MKLDPNYTGAYYIRGCANEKQGYIENAIDDFTMVIEIDPYHVNALYARGACENKRSNFAKAIEDYNLALQLDEERGKMQSPSQRRVGKQNPELMSIQSHRDNFNGPPTEEPGVLQQANLNQLGTEMLMSPNRDGFKDDDLVSQSSKATSFLENMSSNT